MKPFQPTMLVEIQSQFQRFLPPEAFERPWREIEPRAYGRVVEPEGGPH